MEHLSKREHEEQLTHLFEEKLYNLFILPILTYGSETWQLTKEQERKKRGMERKLLDVALRDRKRATWIKEQSLRIFL